MVEKDRRVDLGVISDNMKSITGGANFTVGISSWKFNPGTSFKISLKTSLRASDLTSMKGFQLRFD